MTPDIQKLIIISLKQTGMFSIKPPKFSIASHMPSLVGTSLAGIYLFRQKKVCGLGEAIRKEYVFDKYVTNVIDMRAGQDRSGFL